MNQDTIVMLESGEVPSSLDQAMIGVAMASITWESLDKRVIATNVLLNEMRRLLYAGGHQFATSKIGKYNLIFEKGTDNEE